jgi:hypothetical protein
LYVCIFVLFLFPIVTIVSKLLVYYRRPALMSVQLFW